MWHDTVPYLKLRTSLYLSGLKKGLLIDFTAEGFSYKALIWSLASVQGEGKKGVKYLACLSTCPWFFFSPLVQLFKWLVSVCPLLSVEVFKFFTMCSRYLPKWAVNLGLVTAYIWKVFFSSEVWWCLHRHSLSLTQVSTWYMSERNMPTDVDITLAVLILEKAECRQKLISLYSIGG